MEKVTVPQVGGGKVKSKLYNNPILRGSDLLSKTTSNKGYRHTHWNIDNILLIREYLEDNPNPSHKKINSWAEYINKSARSLQRLIYTLQEGILDEVISDFKSKMECIEFGIINDYVYMNGRKSTLTIKDAKEIVILISNNGFKEETVWNLVNVYSYCESLEVRVICENWDNPTLLRLLKNNNNSDFVQNNPSKRRNMIRNGVI